VFYSHVVDIEPMSASAVDFRFGSLAALAARSATNSALQWITELPQALFSGEFSAQFGQQPA
jgi:hypothetical protein